MLSDDGVHATSVSNLCLIYITLNTDSRVRRGQRHKGEHDNPKPHLTRLIDTDRRPCSVLDHIQPQRQRM